MSLYFRPTIEKRSVADYHSEHNYKLAKIADLDTLKKLLERTQNIVLYPNDTIRKYETQIIENKQELHKLYEKINNSYYHNGKSSLSNSELRITNNLIDDLIKENAENTTELNNLKNKLCASKMFEEYLTYKISTLE